MASTNKTTNYELSQFIGTDKPAWLSDYNQDMSKIDAQMKLNADGVTTASGVGTANTNAIGTLANLTTTAKTDLVSAVNEVDTNADTAQSTAEAAATTANSASTVANALQSYLSITNTGKIVPTVSGASIGNINDVYYALNANGTLGKIYGRIRLVSSTTGTITLTLPVSALNTESQFVISSGCYYVSSGGGQFNIINAKDFTVNTNGTVTIEFSGISVGDTITVWLPPCLYFFTDFGDVINPNN